jgi:surface polysaccharide O-acyltransferase-like enzyme
VSQGRIHSLDAYRAVLMLMGIVLHGAIPFLEFESGDVAKAVLYLCVGTTHVFRMPAFFILAGFFAALLWARRGALAMSRNRLERIVLPLGVMMLVVAPIWVWGSALIEGLVDGHSNPWSHAVATAVDRALPPGDFLHLWFLYHLAWITFATAGVMTWMQRRKISWPRGLEIVRRTFESPWRCVVVFGGLNFVFCASLDLFEVPAGSGWIPNPIQLLYYVIFYTLGWALYASNTNLASAKERAWTLVLVGLACTMLYGGAKYYLDHDPTELGSTCAYLGGIVASSLALFALTRGLMGVFFRYASAGSYTWRYISDSSYWIYLIHLIPAFGLPTLFVGWQAPMLVQYATNLALSMVIGLVTYDLMVRSTFVGRFLNGRRYPRGPRRVRLIALVLVVGCLSLGVANFVQYERAEAAWTERGGAMSLIPFGLAPTGIDLAKAEAGQCRPAGRYAACLGTKSFDDATSQCEKLGAHLVVLETEAEHDTVLAGFKELSQESFWIGLTDREREGHWVWSDDSPLTYDAWVQGQPDDYRGQEDCAQNNWRSDRWNDLSCDARLPYVCEFEPSDVPRPSSSDKNTLPSGPAPSPLSGRWTIDLEEIGRLPEYAAVAPRIQRASVDTIEAMKIEVVFGETAVAMITQTWGQNQVVSTPWRVVETREGQITVEVGEATTQVEITVLDEASLRITQGPRVTFLRRLAAAPGDELAD